QRPGDYESLALTTELKGRRQNNNHMSSHLQTHLTTSTFNVLCHFSGIKKPLGGGFCLLYHRVQNRQSIRFA
ncbi:hypothetical protein DMC50_23150, partial [Shigella flexneri]|nr:hypothetical protein [Shigella flexneri]EGE1954607.1 hypothetical protein [Shigella flexneri]